MPTKAQVRVQRREAKMAKAQAVRNGLKSGKVAILYHKCEVTNIHYRPE